MNNSSFHKDFQLNGNSFDSVDQLLEYTKTLQETIHLFFQDWFSDVDYLIVKTSGSTGKPKNISLKKEHMKNSALATADFFDLEVKTTALCCLPIEYIAGKMMLVRALVCGFHLDIIEPTSSPLKVVDKKYDFCAMVPLQVSNSLDKIHLIHQLIVGGGAVSTGLQEKLQEVPTLAYATYGMTETITHIAVKKLNNDPSLRGSMTKQSYYQSLRDICISQDDRSCLVIDAPKVSDEKIITNDVVELVSETEFIWKGRYDNVINSGGIKLHPEEIEKKLSSYIDSRFFVAGIPDEKLGDKLVLIIEGEKNDIISNYVRNIKNELAKFEKPKQILFVKEFVETETKKIQRQKTLDLILKV